MNTKTVHRNKRSGRFAKADHSMSEPEIVPTKRTKETGDAPSPVDGKRWLLEQMEDLPPDVQRHGREFLDRWGERAEQ